MTDVVQEREKVTGFTKVAPLPMYVQPPRPVEDDWKCKRSGDCCTKPDAVVMTVEERTVIEKALTIKKLVSLVWDDAGLKPGFVALTAHPCPFHEFTGVKGESTCTIHSIRPYQCRRFACLRPDVKAEPFQMAPLSPYLKYGNIGCSNLRDRLVNSRVARRTYELIQRKAQKWALKHGWKQDV